MRRGLAALLLLGACTGVPEGIEPVTGFEPERYLGTWYEIARLDHRFERGLTNVSATYSKGEKADILVLNRGLDPLTYKWREARGRAYFAEGRDVGRLKVSFFGPFYGGYNIIDLDKADYRWALVCGPSRHYLWILARDPDLDTATRDRLVAEAKRLGFATDELIFVKHDLAP